MNYNELSEVTKRTGEWADQLAKASEALGITVEQAYRLKCDPLSKVDVDRIIAELEAEDTAQEPVDTMSQATRNKINEALGITKPSVDSSWLDWYSQKAEDVYGDE